MIFHGILKNAATAVATSVLCAFAENKDVSMRLHAGGQTSIYLEGNSRWTLAHSRADSKAAFPWHVSAQFSSSVPAGMAVLDLL